jgi:alkyl hydroperoxide reductase subunit AhpC
MHFFCSLLIIWHESSSVPLQELGRAADLQPEFEKRNSKLIGLSCNSVDSHKQWTPDIEGSKFCSSKVNYPIIADTVRSAGSS